MANPSQGGAEVAAVLVVPDKDVEFTNRMIRILCGLNNEEWKISQETAL